MATKLPIPIEFSLPEGWRSVSPNEVGVPDVAFVALHPTAVKEGFTANITVAGNIQPESVSMEQIADDALEMMRANAREATLGRRSVVGSADDPGLTQAVRLSVVMNGRPRDLLQLQVFIGVRDQRDPSRRAVLHIVLTTLPDQFDDAVPDFQKFISTIRAEQAA